MPAPPGFRRVRFTAGRRAPLGHTLTGDIRRHRISGAAGTGRPRQVLVYLPPAYEQETARYPVLYVNDGQNVFDGATAFVPGQEWELDETAERLIRAGRIDPLIVVAVDHAGESRFDEFGPVRDAGRRAGGGADAYGRFLVGRVKRFVDRTYRTRAHREHTGLLGSSLGGVVTLHLGLTRPDVFSRLAVMSPSVWWGQQAIVRQVRALAERPPLRVWLDMGTAEGERALTDARALRDAMLAKGWRLGDDLAYEEVEGAPHTESAWAARADRVLEFLFPPVSPRAADVPGPRGTP
ncbi:MAG: esterase [Acidobacteria bacterium]|nr:esterase [Acidobacteriota bacterium]